MDKTTPVLKEGSLDTIRSKFQLIPIKWSQFNLVIIQSSNRKISLLMSQNHGTKLWS